jgi:invasion protein IalB
MKNFGMWLGLLGLLAAANTAQAASTTKIQKSFNNWRVDCAEVDNKAKRCALTYSLVSKKTKQMVFSWVVVPKNKDSVTPPQAVNSDANWRGAQRWHFGGLCRRRADQGSI